MKKRALFNSEWLLALCCLVTFSDFRLSAATVTVTNDNESALRTALAQAAPGDTIRLDLTAPVIETNATNYRTSILLTNGELVINKDLTIIGQGTKGTNYPIIDGQLLSRVFKIVSGNVVLRDLAIINGNSSTAIPPQGAAIYNSATLTVDKCSFTYNEASALLGTNSSGGGIFNQGTLTVHNSGFTNNHSTAGGGAIFNGGTAVITNSSFSVNTARWQGGAIDNAGTLTLASSTLRANYALASGGGGLANQPNALACITESKFFNNTNEYYGGGAIINWGRLFATNTSLAGNAANEDSDDTETSGGGGLFNFGGFAHLSGCMIGPLNFARRGGGILNFSTLPSAPALLVMNGCTFYTNWVSLFGGGLMNWASGGPATACLTNCTVSCNYVDLQDYTAAGIDNTAYLDAATVNLMNCTLASNVVSSISSAGIAQNVFSGVFVDDPSTRAEVTLANSILCGIPPIQAQVYGGGKLTSLGYNLCSDRISPFTNDTDIRFKNPQLSPLVQAGPILVHLLIGANNPAIDHGNPTNSPACDARGYKRPFGRGYDIGAVEGTLEFLKFGTANFYPPVFRTHLNLWFTAYFYPTNYIVEYSTNCAPGSWKVLTNINVNATLIAPTNVINVIKITHDRGGPGVSTNTAYFYRVRTP